MSRSLQIVVAVFALVGCAGPAPLGPWGLKGAPPEILRYEEPDHDRDDIDNAADRCPDLPEDEDGHRDYDGCPDPDNDGDGISDAKDESPDG